MKEDKDIEMTELRRSLEETRFRLYALEQSRPIKGMVFLKKFLKNPVRGGGSLKDLRSVFDKAVLNPPDYDRLALTRLSPRPIKVNNPLLKYPNIKVACIGCLHEFSDVCHAFEAGDANWINLLDRGIDFLVVNDMAIKDSSSARTLIKNAREKEIPLIVIKQNNQLDPLLQHASLVLDRTLPISEEKSDKAFIDIFSYNPIGWQRDSPQVIGFWQDKKSIDSEKCVILKHPSKIDQALEPLSFVVAESHDVFKDFKSFTSLLKYCASGIPVFIYPESSVPHPFREFKSLRDLKKVVNNYLSDKELREKESIEQRNKTILNFGQLSRFETIIDYFNFPKARKESISVIIPTMRPDKIADAIDSFSKQAYSDKELVMLLHGEGFNVDSVKKQLQEAGINGKILQEPSTTIFGEALNIALRKASGDFVTKMDDDDYYGENHLNDLVAAYYYSRADIVGKWANWVYLASKSNLTTSWVIEKQEQYVPHLPGGTFLASRDFLQKSQFGRVAHGIDSELYRRIEARGGIMYSTHRYNYLRIRHGQHTYKASDEDFLSRCTEPTFHGKDYKRVTI